MGIFRLFAALIVLFIAPAIAPGSAAAQAGERAVIQSDGTLKLGNRTIRLYGIHIPQTGRFCRTYLLPPRCASRAVLELDRMIHGFVWCDRVHRYRDGTQSAICRVRRKDSRLGSRTDLAAELLRQGWAVALPGAPFEYVTLDHIARAHNRGVWGFQADSITFR
jgi:endonuclease YncB( thermonuclease family)